MKRNYQKELEETLQKLQAEGKRPYISTALLLCTVQYLCFKVFSPVFYHQNFIL